jgi:hypothetical protein
MKIKIIFKWFDFWVGLFWDSNKEYLYIFPIPMLGIVFKFKTKVIENDVLTPWEQSLEKVVDKIKQEKSTLLCIGILRKLVISEIHKTKEF